jgi:septal ring factor EnvC (AmiA/AmiB activator)
MPDGFEEETSGATGEPAGNLATADERAGTHRPTDPLLAQLQTAPARLAVRATQADEELARLRAENDRFRAERKASLHAQAVAFAQAQAKEGKIDTSEVDFYAFLHEQLSLMDQSDQLPEGTRIGKASVSSRPFWQSCQPSPGAHPSCPSALSSGRSAPTSP